MRPVSSLLVVHELFWLQLWLKILEPLELLCSHSARGWCYNLCSPFFPASKGGFGCIPLSTGYRGSGRSPSRNSFVFLCYRRCWTSSTFLLPMCQKHSTLRGRQPSPSLVCFLHCRFDVGSRLWWQCACWREVRWSKYHVSGMPLAAICRNPIARCYWTMCS